jgi:hypothetical protein
MAGQDLVDSIKQRLAVGETQESVRQSLLSKGWQTADIDAAFAVIPPTPIQSSTDVKLPFSSFWSTWDAKTSNLPAAIIMVIFGFFAFIVLFLAILFYNYLDPLGSRSGARDVTREALVKQVQTALQRYYDAQGKYPTTLNELVPIYLTSAPLDPRTKEPLSYKIRDDKINYELCMEFEMKASSCVSSSVNAFPTATPLSPTVADVAGFPVTGTVFLDFNENGVQDSGEPAFANASVRVVDTADSTICSLKTDTAGEFVCGVPTPGSYQVVLSVPVRYRITIPNPQTVTLTGSDQSKMKATAIFGLVPIDTVPAQDNGSAGGAR